MNPQRGGTAQVQLSLSGLTVLLILDPESAADMEQRGVRQRVAAAGGRCSINGNPPLPAYELSHIVSSNWEQVRRHAPSLARRHIGLDHSPKRQRVLQQSASEPHGTCFLVTPQWLQATLVAGEPQPESQFQMPPIQQIPALTGAVTERAIAGPSHNREPASVRKNEESDNLEEAEEPETEHHPLEEDLTAALLAHLDGLAKLVEAHDPATGAFRKRAYVIAINCIKRYHKLGHVLTARSDFIALCEQPNSVLASVGKKTRDKCSEFLSTRTTRRAAGYESDPRISVEELFKRIWGVGKYTAKKLYEPPHNLRTIAELRAAVEKAESCGQPAFLDNRQLIGLKYFEDLDSDNPQNRIPRAEIEAIVHCVRAAAESVVEVPEGLTVEALGSYRRGKADSGDCDVLLTHDDGISHVGLVHQVKRRLEASGFLLEPSLGLEAGRWGNETVTTKTASPNGHKYLGICRVPPPFGAKARRIDLFSCPPDQYQCARLTYTGSDIHNRSMRHWASKCGYVLSEKALCPTIRKPVRIRPIAFVPKTNLIVIGCSIVWQRPRGAASSSAVWTDDKLWCGDAVPIAAEEDIFEALGLRYLAPRERIGQVEHAPMAEWSAGFVENVFAKRLLRLPQSCLDLLRSANVDGRRLLHLDERSLLEDFGLESPELRRKFIEERDRAAAEEPTAEEALAATEAPPGQGVREEFERRQLKWKRRLSSFWRMNDGY